MSSTIGRIVKSVENGWNKNAVRNEREGAQAARRFLDMGPESIRNLVQTGRMDLRLLRGKKASGSTAKSRRTSKSRSRSR